MNQLASHQRRDNHTSGAFTLVEVLISLALMSIVIAMVTIFFGIGVQIFTKIISTVRVQSEMHSVVNRIRRDVERSVQPAVMLSETAQPSGFAHGLGILVRPATSMTGDSNRVLVPADFVASDPPWNQVAYIIRNGRELVYHPQFSSAADPGPAVVLSHEMAAPASLTGAAPSAYPFRQSIVTPSTQLIEVNFQFLSRAYSRSLSRRFGLNNQRDIGLQNLYSYMQLRTTFFLKNHQIFPYGN